MHRAYRGFRDCRKTFPIACPDHLPIRVSINLVVLRLWHTDKNRTEPTLARLKVSIKRLMITRKELLTRENECCGRPGKRSPRVAGFLEARRAQNSAKSLDPISPVIVRVCNHTVKHQLSRKIGGCRMSWRGFTSL